MLFSGFCFKHLHIKQFINKGVTNFIISLLKEVNWKVLITVRFFNSKFLWINTLLLLLNNLSFFFISMIHFFYILLREWFWYLHTQSTHVWSLHNEIFSHNIFSNPIFRIFLNGGYFCNIGWLIIFRAILLISICTTIFWL